MHPLALALALTLALTLTMSAAVLAESAPAEGVAPMTDDELESVRDLIRTELDLGATTILELSDVTAEAPYAVPGLPLRFFESAWQLEKDPYPIQRWILAGHDTLCDGSHLHVLLSERQIRARSPAEALGLSRLMIFSEDRAYRIHTNETPLAGSVDERLRDQLAAPAVERMAEGYVVRIWSFLPPKPKTSGDGGELVRHTIWMDASGSFRQSDTIRRLIRKTSSVPTQMTSAAAIDKAAAIEAATAELMNASCGIVAYLPFTATLEGELWRVRSARKRRWFARAIGADVRVSDGAIIKSYLPR